ncbi:putative GTP binding protein [Aspergillus mulundensis]|uniref:GTP binding protein n=1 Tax=Aspergillus mulundensis TaxID=1810919 RepID=A0A3D8QZA1_9EURO|nr:hypothetical protein DSM5745_08975 [Aspergillus mulundensis]RDW67109.1 hypothetical protein DSM5745_08975 [Aspergillus mulundensis]
MSSYNNVDIPEAEAWDTEGLDFPSLNEIFPESAPASEPPRTETLPALEQEALLISLENALKKAESEKDIAVFDDLPESLFNLSSQSLLRAAEALANGSRNPSLRHVYGRTGVLKFFLRLISSEEATESNLVLQCLRLIGNSCADTDENRAIVVGYIPAILRYILQPELLQVVIPVLYNLCIDYEPAQSQLAAEKIVYILLTLVRDDAFQGDDALLDYVYELIELAGEQEQGIENSPEGTISLLLDLIKSSDVELAQFCALANCIVAYINKPRFQDICISRRMVPGMLSMLRRSSFFKAESSADTQALTQSQLKINQTLAELSASPRFAELYPLGSALSRTLKSWLSKPEDQLQICACIMLGNLARSDEVCVAMVKELEIHKELIAILNSNARGAALHSALGFLKNLAIPSDNRVLIGEAEIMPAIARLWAYETVPQVQLAATSITRQLVISSAENIRRLLEPVEEKEGQTYLSLLLELFDKTDSTPIKTEIGRIEASLCRTLIPKADAAGGPLLDSLFTHEGMVLPLEAMIKQDQWPVVRSEGWFALALMASTKAGSVAVVDGLQKIDGFSMIEQILSAEEPSDSKTDKVQWRKDRDNIIVLMQELFKNQSHAVSPSWKSTVQELMNTHISKYH